MDYTIFCGKLSDRTPEKGGWPIWAYQLWKGRHPPDCIKCTGDDGGSVRASIFNTGSDYHHITGQVPSGYDTRFKIRFGPSNPDKRVGLGQPFPIRIPWDSDNIIGYKMDVDINSLKQLGCCNCCPYEKHVRKWNVPDETNVKNPNANKAFGERGLSQEQMTDMMSQKLEELDREVVTKQCCV